MKSPESTGLDQTDEVLMCSLLAGPGLFGMDTTQIREVLGATAPCPVPLAPAYIDGVIPYRGEVLTTVNLRSLLGLERSAEAGSVIVLDDETGKERFGLAVDAVGGVIAVAKNAVEPNPSALDARSVALFDGICRTQAGLMVRLDPQRLRPSRLAECGAFGSASDRGTGERR